MNLCFIWTLTSLQRRTFLRLTFLAAAAYVSTTFAWRLRSSSSTRTCWASTSRSTIPTKIPTAAAPANSSISSSKSLLPACSLSRLLRPRRPPVRPKRLRPNLPLRPPVPTTPLTPALQPPQVRPKFLLQNPTLQATPVPLVLPVLPTRPKSLRQDQRG